MAGPSPLRPAPIRPVPPAMNSPERLAEPPAAPEDRSLPKWRLGFRAAVPWLFLILLGGIVMLIGLAGAGLMGDGQYWITGASEFLNAHMALVHIVEALPVLIVLAGFLGGDRQAGWAGVALMVLIGMQYALARLDGVERSFHVLNALIIFTLVLLMTLSRIPWRPKYIDAPPTA
jgi:hypothetical protein